MYANLYPYIHTGLVWPGKLVGGHRGPKGLRSFEGKLLLNVTGRVRPISVYCGFEPEILGPCRLLARTTPGRRVASIYTYYNFFKKT